MFQEQRIGALAHFELDLVLMFESPLVQLQGLVLPQTKELQTELSSVHVDNVKKSRFGMLIVQVRIL